MLSNVRVFDLTDEKGFLCGKLLADLGADVIKIEKPGGDPARNHEPFYHDIADPEKSLSWFAFNVNKRGITLDIECADGSELFKRLVKNADIVLESFAPGYLEKLGLDYITLSKVNPRIIMTSITPFGESGPYKDYKGTDMIVWAMGGMMYLTGEPGQTPLQVSLPQAYLLASLDALVGTCIAHYYCVLTRKGQRVTVAAQESVAWNIQGAHQEWEVNKQKLTRQGACYSIGRSVHRTHRRCKDGYVVFQFFGGASGARAAHALMAWMESEGFPTEHLKEIDWESVKLLSLSEKERERCYEDVAAFFAAHTKKELYEGAIQRGFMLFPVLNAREVLENAQLKGMGYWAEVEHPELGVNIIYPGAFMKASEAPLRIRRRPPLIGEHNEEIYVKELGLSKTQMLILKENRII